MMDYIVDATLGWCHYLPYEFHANRLELDLQLSSCIVFCGPSNGKPRYDVCHKIAAQLLSTTHQLSTTICPDSPDALCYNTKSIYIEHIALAQAHCILHIDDQLLSSP